MSDVAVEPTVEVVAGPVPGSLEQRIEQRRDAIERNTTEVFDVPGYEGIFRVELRTIGWKQLRKIADAHSRIHDDSQKESRTAADSLLAATVAFHKIVNDDGDTEEAEGATWLMLAKAAKKSLGPETKARVAITSMIGETPMVLLFQEWMEWMRSGRGKLEETLGRD